MLLKSEINSIGIVHGIKIDDMLMAKKKNPRKFVQHRPPIKHYKRNKRHETNGDHLTESLVSTKWYSSTYLCDVDIENYVNHSMLHTISMFISVESWLVLLLWGIYKFRRNNRFFFLFKGKEHIPEIGSWWDDSIQSQLVQSRSINLFLSSKNKMLNLDQFHRLDMCWPQRRKILKIFRKHKSSTSFGDCLEIRNSFLSSCVFFF